MPSSSPIIPPKAPVRVLYVEDQELVRSVVAQYLRHYGHQVETACDGLDGWRKFCQGIFDLVITDLEMPHLDGLGLIRRVRETNRSVRIIVHSAGFTSVNLMEMRDLAIDAMLSKGADPLALHATVEKVVRTPR